MRIKDVVKAEKKNVTCDDWQTGRMPKTLFPLGKSGKHSLNFRGGYQWCLIRFDALGCAFRIVVAVNFDKLEYYAHLGKTCGTDTQMLVSYEYHSTHGGWHVHAGCGDIDAIPIGRYKGPWKRRIPLLVETDQNKDWGVVTLADALTKACKAFGVKLPPVDASSEQMPLI